MTQPILARSNPNTGDREYVNPDGDVFLGVTTILSGLPKPYLIKWAAKVVAETAAYIIEDAISEAWAEDDIGQEFVNWNSCLVSDYLTLDGDFDTDEFAEDLKHAYEWERDAAGTLGDEVHDAAEDIMGVSKGNGAIARAYYDDKRYAYSKEAAKRLNHFVTWLEENEVKPLAMECTLYNDTYGYAGSSDLCAVVNGVTRWIDYKTSKQLDPSTALQLAAYSRGEYVAVKESDGSITRHPMPVEYSPDVKAAVLHLQSTQARFIEADISDEVFDVFLTVMLLKKGWLSGKSKQMCKEVLYTTKPKKVKKDVA